MWGEGPKLGSTFCLPQCVCVSPIDSTTLDPATHLSVQETLAPSEHHTRFLRKYPRGRCVRVGAAENGTKTAVKAVRWCNVASDQTDEKATKLKDCIAQPVKTTSPSQAL